MRRNARKIVAVVLLCLTMLGATNNDIDSFIINKAIAASGFKMNAAVECDSGLVFTVTHAYRNASEVWVRIELKTGKEAVTITTDDFLLVNENASGIHPYEAHSIDRHYRFPRVKNEKKGTFEIPPNEKKNFEWRFKDVPESTSTLAYVQGIKVINYCPLVFSEVLTLTNPTPTPKPSPTLQPTVKPSATGSIPTIRPTATPKAKVKCHRCNGNQKVDCSSCSGRGYYERQKYDSVLKKMIKVKEPCNICHGSKKVKCGWCNGSGYEPYSK